MNFIKKIGANIYNPSFYAELLNKPLKYSFKYFFGLILFLSLISTIIISAQVFPGVSSMIESLKSYVITYYPAGLEVTIKNGVASTNVTEPYFIKVPQETADMQKEKKIPSDEVIENILVIDTKNSFDLAKFQELKTAALLTKDALIYRDKNDKITLQSLSKMPNMTITRDKVLGFVDKLMPYLRMLPFILPILIFIGIYFAGIFLLVYFLLAALLVFFVAKIKKVETTYKKSYQISMHAFTLSLVLATVLEVFHYSLPLFAPTVIMLIIVLLNLEKPATSLSSS